MECFTCIFFLNEDILKSSNSVQNASKTPRAYNGKKCKFACKAWNLWKPHLCLTKSLFAHSFTRGTLLTFFYQNKSNNFLNWSLSNTIIFYIYNRNVCCNCLFSIWQLLPLLILKGVSFELLLGVLINKFTDWSVNTNYIAIMLITTTIIVIPIWRIKKPTDKIICLII